MTKSGYLKYKLNVMGYILICPHKMDDPEMRPILDIK